MVAGLAFCLRHPPIPRPVGMTVIDSARFALRAVAMLAAAACPSAAVYAQGIPYKAIRVIVPFTLGETVDVFARDIGYQAQ
jgi:tripartite-type tricarboxylate transporter receptor subunit TctC